VDTEKVDGPDNNHFGVICRFQDIKNYYLFLISSDGYYGIARVKNGETVLLKNDHLVFDEIVQRGYVINHLQANCVGNQLSLMVNNHLLITVRDDTFVKGDIGLLAGAYELPGVDILFTHLAVYQP
jgi:hypothetical protein